MTDRRRQRGHRSQGGWARPAAGTGRAGYACAHSAVDDHPLLAYSEVDHDEIAATAIGFWGRAIAFYAENGISVARVLSDNRPAYKQAWRVFNARQAIAVKYTRPYCPGQRESRAPPTHSA